MSDLDELREGLIRAVAYGEHKDTELPRELVAEFEAAVGEKVAQAIEGMDMVPAHGAWTRQDVRDMAARIAREVAGGTS